MKCWNQAKNDLMLPIKVVRLKYFLMESEKWISSGSFSNFNSKLLCDRTRVHSACFHEVSILDHKNNVLHFTEAFKKVFTIIILVGRNFRESCSIMLFNAVEAFNYYMGDDSYRIWFKYLTTISSFRTYNVPFNKSK